MLESSPSGEPRFVVPEEIAPSAPIAVAARAFGDRYPLRVPQRGVRLCAVGVLVGSACYVPWLLTSLDRRWWISVPFATVSLFSVFYGVLNVLNMWTRRVPMRFPVLEGSEPDVAVIIPTCGEPVPMVLRTVVSVLEQDWPLERLFVVVSDDGRDPALRHALQGLPVHYLEPPDRWAPGRDGAAKAGNLNAALEFVRRERPDIAWIETRDADDEVGSNRFLREVVGQLLVDDRLAYVQTIKEAQVSPGDPFNNRESVFYRGQMLARNAHNAVFPCGSGLVWRREALEDIGGFPTWNLVEDLQSGVEALRRGWRSLYLPIVGAVGQIAPEDVPNFFKQRGTWCIDTVRLMLWGNLEGLTFRQRWLFRAMMLDYLDAFTVLVYLPVVVLTMWGLEPLDASGWGYLLCFAPMALSLEAWQVAMSRPFFDRRGRRRSPLRELYRHRTMRAGMAPVFQKASLQAIAGGRHRKPVYVVTRKDHDLRWHWRQTMPQAIAVFAVVALGSTAVVRGRLPDPVPFGVALYWGGMQIVLLATFVSRGWQGLLRSHRSPRVPWQVASLRK